MSSILRPNRDCNYTITIKEMTVCDFEHRCLYSTANAVSLLPIRRVSTKVGQLQETIISLRELQPLPLTALIRIKHVALDFCLDFNVEKGCVPGQRFIGKISINTESKCAETNMPRGQRVFVYPYSTCLIQNIPELCKNCCHISSIPDHSENHRKDLYELHKNFPCLKKWVYGKTIHGGLQDYIRIPHPLQQLIPVPELVSLHDCCFLLDVATPFLAYCKDILSALPDFASKVLIILNDVNKEANDCLLVIQHLLLNQHYFTFTDMQTLFKHPEIKASYTGQFRHIFVLAVGQQAFEAGLTFQDTSADSAESPSTISIMASQSAEKLLIPDSIEVKKICISYKDRFLLETLLETISDMNKATIDRLSKRSAWCLNSSINSAGGYFDELTDSLFLENVVLLSNLSSPREVKSESKHGSPKFSIHTTSEESIVGRKGQNKKVVRWLLCDYSFSLGLDDLCDQDYESRCMLTKAINRLRAEGFAPKRVFFTNTQRNNASLNAFIFS